GGRQQRGRAGAGGDRRHRAARRQDDRRARQPCPHVRRSGGPGRSQRRGKNHAHPRAGGAAASGRAHRAPRPPPRLLRAARAGPRPRHLAYLPQGHVFHWPLPVASVVALGREPHADAWSPPSEQDRAAVQRALCATGIDGLAERSIVTLSGGERARAALARALATEAPVLRGDEPAASLDPRHQLTVMGLLRHGAAQGAVLAIVHDLLLAARFADRVIVMDRGRLVADAPPSEALTPDRLAAVFGVA